MKFGEWLVDQVNRPGDTLTDQAIRKLARMARSDSTCPVNAISYGTYQRWLMRQHKGSANLCVYMRVLDVAWVAFERTLQTKLDAAKE